MNQMKIGQNLSAIRLQHGLTQAELAEAADVTTDHISHVENGSNGISLELLLKICRALGITPNDILSGEYETEEKSDDHTLSLDQLEPSDIDLIEKIAHYLKNKKTKLN
ncbi:MAG: helix-turn-helix transcriptional regulator [Lachnospiraceae bacterium]|nr:helix-turn-helix transcriptional regulator [Lachnospiraceae bacterium]